MPATDTDERVTALGALVFFTELLMLAGLAWAGARLPEDDGLSQVIAAVVLPIVALTMWARWLAPKAPHRFAYPVRLLAKLALFAATAVLLGVAGLVVVAVVFFVIGGGLVTVGELHGLNRPTRRLPAQP